MIVVTVPSNSYDSVASFYDEFYSAAEDIAENWAVQQLLASTVEDHLSFGNIMDVGAGTGLFLDMFPKATGITTCLDPSRNMLERLHFKHPEAKCVQGDHNTLKRCQPSSLVVSLFSSLCHAPKAEVPDAVSASLAEGGTFFGMFAAPGEHHSMVLRHANVEFDLESWGINELSQLASQCRPKKFHIVAVNRFLCLFLEGAQRG